MLSKDYTIFDKLFIHFKEIHYDSRLGFFLKFLVGFFKASFSTIFLNILELFWVCNNSQRILFGILMKSIISVCDSQRIRLNSVGLF